MNRELDIKLKEATEMLSIQEDSYDFDPYMHGMYNGMEFILSIIVEREPIFKDAPKIWTKDNVGVE